MKFIQIVFGKGILRFLFEPILQDDLVNDLAAKDAPPPEKFLTNAVEFFEYHCSSAPIALHHGPPLFEFGGLSAIFVPVLIFY
jgi:hypothetical protein